VSHSNTYRSIKPPTSLLDRQGLVRLRVQLVLSHQHANYIIIQLRPAECYALSQSLFVALQCAVTYIKVQVSSR